MADNGAVLTTPSSGGTPSAMVAVPVLNSALEQRLSILGGTGVGTKMETSIHLRAAYGACAIDRCEISKDHGPGVASDRAVGSIHSRGIVP